MRLKWYGLYAHNTKDGHFMLRTKVVQGMLTADQAEVMASITEDFAPRDHRLHDAPVLPEPLAHARQGPRDLLPAREGRDDDLRRLRRHHPQRHRLHARRHRPRPDRRRPRHAEAIHDYFLDNKLYSNLPRKYKISVTGCREDCARGLINDIALSGAIPEDGTRGFNIRVGGGLSSAPRFSRWIDVFVTPEEAPEVIAAMTAIFRDSEENRAKRGSARLKFLVDASAPTACASELVGGSAAS